MPKRIVSDSHTSSLTEAAARVSSAVMDPPAENVPPAAPAPVRRNRSAATTTARHFSAMPHDDHSSNHQAELFYLQKQIQLQTQMVFVLEDSTRIQGVVEWYDRHSIKVRGKSRVLIYKSAIKYLYKAGEIGTSPEA